MIPGCSLGGTAMSTTSIAGSSSISSSVAISPGHARSAAAGARLLDRARREAHDAKAGIGVGRQVAVADDEARADDSDPQPAPLRRGRKMFQADGGVRCHRRLTHAAAWASCPLRSAIVRDRSRSETEAAKTLKLFRGGVCVQWSAFRRLAARAVGIAQRLKPARELGLGRSAASPSERCGRSRAPAPAPP